MTARRKPGNKHIHAGFDLSIAAKRYCKVLGIGVPGISWRRGRGTRGRAWRTRITITIDPASPLSVVCELLLHELTHIAMPAEHHSERFIAKLVSASRELWPVRADGWTAVKRGNYVCRAYAVDDLIRSELAAAVAAGFVAL